MARRQFKVPFAATGDKVSVPDAVQPDGSVSLQEGYGFDYQRDPQTDPLAKVFPRDAHNGLLNEITASIGEIQQQGYAIWTVAGAPYMINAVVRHSDQNWQSNIANNSDEPGVGAGTTSWKMAGASVDGFNSLAVSVASAATVNLTSSAPVASQLIITGNASINAFTVAAGRAFVARFSSTLTLTNGASLVTNTGANITVYPGDSCIIRAISENIVEILCGNFLQFRSVGSGAQIWQSFTGSRSTGTVYTNNSGRAIEISITIRQGASGSGRLLINGVIVSESTPVTGGDTNTVTAIVPDKASYIYSVITGNQTIIAWAELRA